MSKTRLVNIRRVEIFFQLFFLWRSKALKWPFKSKNLSAAWISREGDPLQSVALNNGLSLKWKAFFIVLILFSLTEQSQFHEKWDGQSKRFAKLFDCSSNPFQKRRCGRNWSEHLRERENVLWTPRQTQIKASSYIHNKEASVMSNNKRMRDSSLFA